MWKLESENLSNVGGPMWNQKTWLNYTKIFSSSEKAKAYAESEIGRKLAWLDNGTYESSGDLGYVMYRVRKIEVDPEFIP